MYTIIIFTISGILISVYNELKDKYRDWGFVFILSLLGALAGASLGFLVSMIIPKTTEIKGNRYNIISLQDNSSVSGHFFLGSGVIDGGMKYCMYYEYGDGYRMFLIGHNDASIVFSDDPHLVQYEDTETDDIINKFSMRPLDNSYYVIHVPKGTIRNQYNLDAK